MDLACTHSRSSEYISRARMNTEFIIHSQLRNRSVRYRVRHSRKVPQLVGMRR
jgi:hypothetical protein